MDTFVPPWMVMSLVILSRAASKVTCVMVLKLIVSAPLPGSQVLPLGVLSPLADFIA